MNKKFYITTTLPYVNAEPHLGFALEIIQADIGTRLLSFVRNLTGENLRLGFSATGKIEGSCGSVSVGMNGVPKWVEYNVMTGEFFCKLCRRGLSKTDVGIHRCKC